MKITALFIAVALSSCATPFSITTPYGTTSQDAKGNIVYLPPASAVIVVKAATVTPTK